MKVQFAGDRMYV